MAEQAPVGHSPISPAPPVAIAHGWQISARHSVKALRITDCTPVAKLLVRASVNGETARSLRVPFGRAARDEHGTLVVGCGPGEWLLFAPPGAGSEVFQRMEHLSQHELVSVVDATHGRVLLRITGTGADALLAKVCAIDLAGGAADQGAAFRSSVAGVVTDVVRDDRGRELSYLLSCERSVGQHLFDALGDAGREFELDVDGFTLPGI